MSDWLHRLLPNAKSEDEKVILYSYEPTFGTWRISTIAKRLKPSLFTKDGKVDLEWNPSDGWSKVGEFRSVFVAKTAVVDFKTGVRKWDRAKFAASDQISEWKREVSDQFISELLLIWMETFPDEPMSKLIFHFEHEATRLINRNVIKDILTGQILSNQIERLPSRHMAPREMNRLYDLADKRGVPY